MGEKKGKLLKIIKKTGKWLGYLVCFLLLLGIGGYFALKNPKVQTWISQKLATYLGKELNARVEIKGVDIAFFSKIILEGIYVEDQHKDTILYAGKLQVDIDKFDYENRYLSISAIDLYDAAIKAKKYPNERGLSYRFILQYFKSTDTTTTDNPNPWDVRLDRIGLHDVIFAYKDTRWDDADLGMDYEDIRVTGINGSFTDINPMGDSLGIHINDLQAKEKCGLQVDSLNAIMLVADTFIRFDYLNFKTPDSHINGFISFQFHSFDDIEDDFIHKVKLDGHFSQSIVEMGDVAYFAPDLLGMRKKILLTGDVRGTIDHLRCKNIDLRFGEISHITGDFAFNGLPDIETTDMNFKIRRAVTNKKDLEGVPVAPFGPNDFIEFDPEIGDVAALGTMYFSGNFEGFYYDFLAHGKLSTDMGNLTLENLSMSRENDSALFVYHGVVNSDAFNFGKYYDVTGLGRISGNVEVAGRGFSKSEINADVDGNVSLLEYQGYPYSGITVTNGNLKRQIFSGDVDVNDPNLNMDFSGEIDRSGKLPVFKFKANIDTADLGDLGFLDKSHKHLLTAKLSTNLTGDNIDTLDGFVNITELTYIRDKEKFHFTDMHLQAGNTSDSTRTIFLESDVLSANIKGRFQIMEVPDAIRDIMSDYLPAYFPPPDRTKEKRTVQDFKWSLTFGKNTQPLQALVPSLVIAPGTYTGGSFDNGKRQFNFTLQCPEKINYDGVLYQGIEIGLGNQENEYCTAEGRIGKIMFNDTIGLQNMGFKFQARDNELISALHWDNKTVKQNTGNLVALVHFENQQSVRMNIQTASIVLNDSAWLVRSGNEIRFDSSDVSFKKLVLHSGKQSIGLDGRISKDPSAQLWVDVHRFNIAYFNYFTEPKGLTMTGVLDSSKTMLSDLYNTPIFTSNTHFENYYINKRKMGDGLLDAVWDKNKEAVYMHGDFTRGIRNEDDYVKNLLFEGHYYPKRKKNSLDLNVNLFGIELDILQPIMKDYCSMMVGNVGGQVHVGGEPEKPLLKGELDLQIRRLNVDYLGLSLAAHVQKIKIEEDGFFFDDFKLFDTNRYGDTAKVYGHLYHTNFSDFQFDMDFSFDHFMVLNTTAAQNELYYGRMFASGNMNIFGKLDNVIRIDMDLKTEKIVRSGEEVKSVFNIPMTSTSETGTADFIVFESKKDTSLVKTKKSQLRSNGLELHLHVNATPDAQVKVVFDKTVGDELTAYGNGTIGMDITPAGDFSMRGQYEVDKGSYLFTMKNVVYVPFELAKGGVISWNGDPYEALIDADAVYKVTASVDPFFPFDSVNQAYHRAYPVDVVMHLDSSLMNPSIGFDINLPTADQTIQETVKSHTQTDLERNRQVLALMVLSSFITPSELKDETNSTAYGNAGSTLLSNFASGVLNNWLSQINSDVNMEVKYRPGDDLTPQELKLYLSTQVLNNRVTIDGNVGKQSATQTGSTGQWVGDVNVEYKVTNDGRVRLRAFYRSNDNSTFNGSAPYTPGVAVFYREEFESTAELLARMQEALARENPNRGKDSAGK
jgi:TamB, inner membrane protein subunit of TAM complex